MTTNSPKEHTRVLQMLDVDSYAIGYEASTDAGSNEIDTKGFRFADIIVSTGTHAGVLPLTVQSTATTGGTLAAITGASLPIIATDDLAVFRGTIDMHSTSVTVSRFLQLEGEVATGAIEMSVMCILWNPRDTATDLTLGGAAGVSDEPDFEIN